LFDTEGGAEAWVARRGRVKERWVGGGPEEARRSRKERRGGFLKGVPSGMGDADVPRESGVRRVGSLDPEEGVKAAGVGDRLA
jgi:hypothetical protein